MSRLTSWAALAAVLGGMPVAHGAEVPTTNRQEVGIAPQSLGAALNEFARQSGLHLIYASDLAVGLRSNGAPSGLSPAETLERLLSGTGLAARWLNERTVSIGHVGEDESPYHEIADSQGGPTPVGTYAGQQAEEEERAPSDQSRTAKASTTDTNPKKNESDDDVLNEVVVTGTLIRGATPASPVIVITREAIEQSGLATTADLIRSLPESFGGGQNPLVNGTGQNNAVFNYGSVSTANLRGLGSDATLTLINGHRLAYNGVSNSVDISVIPLAAVDRIEILTDGASALYGSDAVAGVVNVILKKDFNGAETSIRYGDSTSGGAGQRQFDQTVGMSSARGGFLLTYENLDSTHLLASERDFSAQTSNPTSLLPGDLRNTGLFSGHFDVMPALSLFADALFTHHDPVSLTSYAPYLPSLTFSTYTPSKQWGLATGVRFSLPHDWAGSATVSAAQDAMKFDVYSTNSSDYPPYYYSLRNSTQTGDLEASGPIASIWSGAVSGALNVGYRRELTDLDLDPHTGGGRHIEYGALEFDVPLVAKDTGRLGLERLELSIAARHEHYSDFGARNNPKIGLTYAPARDLDLKATWGRSFHAPGLYQKYSPQFTTAEEAANFGVNAPGDVGLFGSGGNPSLGAETAHQWTTSVDYKPSWLSGAKISISAYDIDYQNRITEPLASQVGLLGNPLYAPFIVMNPSAALIYQVTHNPYTLLNYGTVPVTSTDVFAYYQDYFQNVARQTLLGFDVLLDYRFNTVIGRFDANINLTHTDLSQYATLGAPRNTLSGYIFNPPRYRSRAGLNWQAGPWQTSLFANYTSTEIDNSGTFISASQSFNRPIGSWTTVDAQVAYDLREQESVFRGLRIALSVTNVFDRAPPYVPFASLQNEYAGLGFDPTNTSPVGRFIAITGSKKF